MWVMPQKAKPKRQTRTTKRQPAKKPKTTTTKESRISPGDTITAAVGVTIEVAKYSFVRLDASLQTTVRPFEDEQDAFERAFSTVEDIVNEKQDEVLKKKT